MSPETLADPMRPRVARIEMARAEMPGVTTLAFNGGGTASSPGQFYMLYAFGVGEAAISVSGDPTIPNRQVHTIRRAGAISNALAALGPGDSLGVRGPFGHGWPMEDIEDQDLVIMAGGLGLAPLRPAILRALRSDGRARRVILLYGARNPDLILYRTELDDWIRCGAEVHVTVDSAGADWPGRVGLVTHLVSRAGIVPDRTVAFVCGPEVMMRFSAQALSDLGVCPDRIWMSMERNMKCAIGHCGHCQFGADYVCKEGPVFRYDRVRGRLMVREI